MSLTDAPAPRHYARAGAGGFYPEIGEGWQPAVSVAAGTRVGDGLWFAEVQTVSAKAEQDIVEDGHRKDCEGALWIHTVNFGREFPLFGVDGLTARGHVGLGGFHYEDLAEDDCGAAGTAGAGLQYELSESLRLLGRASWFGIFSDLDRDDRELRHNAMLDLSLVFVF